MKTIPSGHEFNPGINDPNFCAECCFPAADHAPRNAVTIKEYVTKDKSTRGRIVKRNKDGKYFFELLQWMGKNVGWHPLTVGYQTGLMENAFDRFTAWKTTDL